MIVNEGRSTSDRSMSRTLLFKRSSQTPRVQITKAQLLPILRAVANELALQAHLSLEALRTGATDAAPAQSVTEAMLLAKFLADAGHGEFSDDVLAAADLAIATVFDAGRESSIWQLPASEVETFAAIVALYDHQLQRATLGALTAASERLERFKCGESYQQAQRRRA
ncbi:hypothetical protein BUMB_03144 [Candidatus Paraburkholderia calva]|nr:hypothetical protein BUMB_03144 [Candidatus Paraburkholderia calva]